MSKRNTSPQHDIEMIFKALEDMGAEVTSDDDCTEVELAIEPSEDDIYITPSGQLGSKLSVSAGGKFLGEYTEHADAEAAIKSWMEKNQFWPSIWFVSDHGNISPYTME